MLVSIHPSGWLHRLVHDRFVGGAFARPRRSSPSATASPSSESLSTARRKPRAPCAPRTCSGAYASACTISIKPFAHQLEDGDEGHRDAHAALFGPEQLHELDETRPLERRENIRHARAHRQPLALHVVVREHLRARHHVLERDQHFLQRDLRQQRARPCARSSSALPIQVSRSMRGSASMSSAALLKRSYSCRRRTSSARGSLFLGVRIGRRAAAACAT